MYIVSVLKIFSVLVSVWVLLISIISVSFWVSVTGISLILYLCLSHILKHYVILCILWQMITNPWHRQCRYTAASVHYTLCSPDNICTVRRRRSECCNVPDCSLQRQGHSHSLCTAEQSRLDRWCTWRTVARMVSQDEAKWLLTMVTSDRVTSMHLLCSQLQCLEGQEQLTTNTYTLVLTAVFDLPGWRGFTPSLERFNPFTGEVSCPHWWTNILVCWVWFRPPARPSSNTFVMYHTFICVSSAIKYPKSSRRRDFALNPTHGAYSAPQNP